MLNRYTIISIIILSGCLIMTDLAESGWIRKSRKGRFKGAENRIRFIQDIEYSNKSPRCKLDIYLKDMPAPEKPIILFVHGGGWKAGDKSGHTQKGEYFAENGFIFISMNYPLFPEAGYQIQAQSVARAIAWIYNHAAQYNGNGKEIILMGHSAGGHLAALVSTDDEYLKTCRLGLKNIKQTILLDPAGLDILRIRQHYPGAFYVIYNEVFGKDPKVLRHASPITHIRDGKKLPAFLVFYSTSNEKISKPAIDFFNRAGKKNPNGGIYGIDANHFKINKNIGDKNDTITRIIMDYLTRSPRTNQVK